MVVLNYTGGEVNAKIVYYGPGLSGKTTNLEFIHDRTPEGSRGKMVSMKTQTDRTLFFDFLPLELGEINGYRTRFLLYTVPGQVYYNATRKLVLKGADAVVFVADSSRGKLDENLESLRNLEQNLNEHGMSLDEIPWVIQYNKRDTGDAMAVADLNARLNPLRVSAYEAIATQGAGVYETFHGIATLVYGVLKERLERGDLAAEPGQPAAARPVAPVAPAKPAPAPLAVPHAQGEVEFDSAIDSMLREMDAPPSRPFGTPVLPAAPAAPAIPAAPVMTAAPARPAPPVYAATPPAPAPIPAPVALAPAAPVVQTTVNIEPVPAQVFTTSPAPAQDEFRHGRDAFDLELGRLPSLDDASFASDTARQEGPNEFVTDPMRAAAPKPAAPAPVLPRPAPPRIDPAPDEVKLDSPSAAAPPPAAAPAPVPQSVTVPVVLTRAQIRSGEPVHLVLDIRVKDE
jgi:signal recognition particle receptor subunit beta